MSTECHRIYIYMWLSHSYIVPECLRIQTIKVSSSDNGISDSVIEIENPAASEDAGDGDNCLNQGCVE